MWSLIPLPYKLIGAGALVFFLFLGLRWYGNSQYDKGIESGKQTILRDQEKILKENEAKIREELKTERTQLELDREQVRAEKTELDRSRRTFQQTLSTEIAGAIASRETKDEIIDKIPASELDDAIRSTIRALAAGAKPSVNR